MSPDHLLSRLERVRQIGSGRWVARCPAHDDGRPSLSIKDGGDKILLHCFAGCDKGEILHAIGLRYGDLFDGDNPRPAVKRDDFMDRALLEIWSSDREAGRKFTAEELEKERAVWRRVNDCGGSQ